MILAEYGQQPKQSRDTEVFRYFVPNYTLTIQRNLEPPIERYTLTLPYYKHQPLTEVREKKKRNHVTQTQRLPS